MRSSLRARTMAKKPKEEAGKAVAKSPESQPAWDAFERGDYRGARKLARSLLEGAAPEPAKAEEKPAKPAKKLALDDVRTALQDFAKRQDGDPQAGILKVRELLMSFKSVKGEPCQKISELQDEDYPAVVAKCAA